MRNKCVNLKFNNILKPTRLMLSGEINKHWAVSILLNIFNIHVYIIIYTHIHVSIYTYITKKYNNF